MKEGAAGLARGVLQFLRDTPATNEAKGKGHLVTLFMLALLLGEAVLCGVIIWKVPYTEIDWVAYMEQVDLFRAGERDYTQLRGGTGPCVYPAAHLYIFSALSALTRDGADIHAAQLCFAALYVATLAAVLALYRRCAHNAALPTAALALLCASRRLHSVFVLRLFNDGAAMTLFYAAALLLARGRWRGGCALYALAVGVKMNVLLAAPGLLLLLLQQHGGGGSGGGGGGGSGGDGIGDGGGDGGGGSVSSSGSGSGGSGGGSDRAAALRGTALCLSICAGVQALIGAPFLLTHPVSYVRRAFDFSRVFEHRYTVNLKFLNERAFVSRALSAALLAAMLCTLAAFAVKWTRAAAASARRCPKPRALSPQYVLRTLLVSNFIGVVFARSMHYQFYAWYFHSLPLLLWTTQLPTAARLLLLAAIELAFNVYPSTPASSALLQAAHLVLLAALWAAPVPVVWVPVGDAAGAGAAAAAAAAKSE